MKNRTLLITNIITAAAFIIVSVLYFNNLNKAKIASGPAGLCTNTCFAFNPPPVFKGVKGALAKALVENYRTHQWLTYRNLGPTQLPDARSVWFSVDRLKYFLYEIEKSACDSKCDMKKMVLGVRVYYGTYPEEKEWNNKDYELVADGINPNYSGEHTVLFVPTYYDGQNDVDFDPLHWNAGECLPLPMDSVFNVAGTMGFLVPTKMPNHGGLHPPRNQYDNRVNPDGSVNINVSGICKGTTFAKVVDGLLTCVQ